MNRTPIFTWIKSRNDVLFNHVDWTRTSGHKEIYRCKYFIQPPILILVDNKNAANSLNTLIASSEEWRMHLTSDILTVTNLKCDDMLNSPSLVSIEGLSKAITINNWQFSLRNQITFHCLHVLQYQGEHCHCQWGCLRK